MHRVQVVHQKGYKGPHQLKDYKDQSRFLVATACTGGVGVHKTFIELAPSRRADEESPKQQLFKEPREEEVDTELPYCTEKTGGQPKTTKP